MQLPEEFLRETRSVLGPERFECYLKAFEEEPPVSIRLNPLLVHGRAWCAEHSVAVPWCPAGFYLDRRPQFTFDPLLHAGCYYVQEASSMFLDEVLRQHLPDGPVAFLDMCAAPGGKSTLIRSALGADSLLVSNEPVRKRAQVLSENICKWGYDQCYVTNNYPKDFSRAGMQFDAILCDVPCSGEGMFRKDEATIAEWSLQHVEHCWQLQREIVADAWECLNEGGLFIYSTCTFNTKENEENVRWMLSQFDAQVLPIETRPEWNITGSLLDGFIEPVYRFIPGITRSEGLFMCVLRKGKTLQTLPRPLPVREGSVCSRLAKQIPGLITPLPYREGLGESLSLSYQQAIAFLRREALVLPSDAPRGIVEVCFMGQPLGMVKNLGTRANNLYPKEWRIKSTYVPSDYEPIVVPMSEKI